MTKCEEAQKGIDEMMHKLEVLTKRARNMAMEDFQQPEEEESLSI